jgi:hypothetical protein
MPFSFSERMCSSMLSISRFRPTVNERQLNDSISW